MLTETISGLHTFYKYLNFNHDSKVAFVCVQWLSNCFVLSITSVADNKNVSVGWLKYLVGNVYSIQCEISLLYVICA